jgi:hypothetical protein
MYTRTAIPRRAPAQARALAWLPELHATRPGAPDAGSNSSAWLAAPRALNAPVTWRVSSFSRSSTRTSPEGNATSGVRAIQGAMRSRAAASADGARAPNSSWVRRSANWV